MDAAPGHVIRMLREGLGMSQAEFARALDWSPATISAWERGRSQPGRLAFKVILAFAEERGVRYRPKLPVRDLVPVAASVPVAARVADVWRAPTPVGLPAPHAPGERMLAVTAGRQGWSAEATFRVVRPAAASGERRSLGGTMSAVGVGVATLCAALALGLPGSARHAALPSPQTAALRESRPAAHRWGTALPEAAPARALAAAVISAPVVATAPPAGPLARLDGLLLVGGRHRATFQTNDDSITVPEGS